MRARDDNIYLYNDLEFHALEKKIVKYYLRFIV